MTLAQRGTEDMFGGWQVAPAALAGGVSFDASSPPPAAVPVWRSELPADPQEADDQLASREARLKASRADLAAAAGRLDAFVERQASALSFATPEPAPGQPEVKLAAALETLHVKRQATSFGLAQDLARGWNEAPRRFQDLTGRVQNLVANFACVETCCGQQLVGQTVVHWTGHVHTVWQAGLDTAQAQLHRRNLELALEQRQAAIDMVVRIVQCAAKLPGLLATPGGAVLALPLAWQFIDEALAELDRQRKT